MQGPCTTLAPSISLYSNSSQTNTAFERARIFEPETFQSTFVLQIHQITYVNYGNDIYNWDRHHKSSCLDNNIEKENLLLIFAAYYERYLLSYCERFLKAYSINWLSVSFDVS